MSFRVFAAGTDGFNYSRNNQLDEDIFVTADVIAAFNTMRSTRPPAVAAGAGAADYVLPSEDGAIREAVRGIAEMTFLRTLQESVSLLATCTEATQGWISVSAYRSRSRTFWGTLGVIPELVPFPHPERSRFARYSFMRGDNPGSEFVRAIAPALEATALNHYGVLRAMSIALSQYWGRIGRSARPMIQIQLNH